MSESPALRGPALRYPAGRYPALRYPALTDLRAALINVLLGNQSAYFPTAHDAQSYIWRHWSLTDWYEMWVSHGAGGHYAALTYNAWTAGIWAMGRLREGIVGTHIHHTSGAVTKTGTFGTFSNSEIYGGSAGWSATAGDTFACTVTGSTLGLRCVYLTNGGFATIAIDGDYTAADRLPAVSAADVSAGYFDAGQIGHRYICCYANSANSERRDVNLTLSESLSAGSHDITVRVQGTRPAGSGDRVFVSAFVGATGSQTPGDAGTAMFYVREAAQDRVVGLSAMEMAWRFTPDSGGTEQWIGANHGNETLDSRTFNIDGTPQTFSADQIRAGSTVSIERAISMTHPDAIGDVAQKSETVTGNAAHPVSFVYESDVAFDQAGTLGVTYNGMLRQTIPIGGMIETLHFDRGIVGVTTLVDLTGISGNVGGTRSVVTAQYSADHDTMMMLYTSDVAKSLNNWAKSDPLNAYFSLDSTGGKAYMARVSATQTEAVTDSTVIQSRFGWRVLRIEDCANLIAGILS